ncbi:MAG: hypothetical protein A4E28_01375 [Methanocella sp. PtaU1.Bin125]|nr:MAG: hypothetical protein A4E28_01375 [Methanocella sp. PtaU1.Bin125]
MSRANGDERGIMGESKIATFRDLRTLVHTLKKWLLIAAGTLCVCLGITGIFLPLLPTTPFLLLAAACYAASSDRFYRWLINNRWFGRYIRNYREGRGLTLTAKILSVTMLWAAIGYSAGFVVQSVYARFALIAIAVAVTSHILSRPTYRESGIA